MNSQNCPTFTYSGKENLQAHTDVSNAIFAQPIDEFCHKIVPKIE
jgi:hypothetical protein